jgi:hypothetical protein
MAKAKLSQQETTKVKKLTVDELKNLVDVQQRINNITLNLGNAELAKQSMLAEYSKVKEEWDIVAKTLEDKYGQVNVNLADGTIEPIDASANPLG